MLKRMVNIQDLEGLLTKVNWLLSDLDSEELDKGEIRHKLTKIRDFILTDILNPSQSDKNQFKREIYSLMIKAREKGNTADNKLLYELYKKIDMYEQECLARGDEFVNFYELYFEYIDKARGVNQGCDA